MGTQSDAPATIFFAVHFYVATIQEWHLFLWKTCNINDSWISYVRVRRLHCQ